MFDFLRLPIKAWLMMTTLRVTTTSAFPHGYTAGLFYYKITPRRMKANLLTPFRGALALEFQFQVGEETEIIGA